MKLCRRVPPHLRVLVVGVGIPALMMLALFALFLHHSRQQAIDGSVNAARTASRRPPANRIDERRGPIGSPKPARIPIS